MTRRYVFIAAASMAMLAACSGSDDQVRVTGPDPVTAPSITSTPDTTQPAPAPTTPATNETVPATTTEPAPITTLDPLAEIEAAVKQARLDLEDAYFAAASDPGNQELRDVYRMFYTEEAFVGREAFLDSLVLDGTVLSANKDVPKSISFREPFRLVSDTSAVIRMCRIDSDVIQIPASDSSPAIVIDDRIVATLDDVDFRLIENRWVLGGGERLGQWIAQATCNG